MTDAYWYDAYGNLVDRVGNSENDYLFAGEQFDERLGQYYLRQRYYDPATGRFTRRDTWEGNNFEPVTLHKYLYGNGNPVSYVDPSGLFAILLREIAVVSVLIASLAYLQNTQPIFGGFNALPQTSTDDIFRPYPRDPNASVLNRLLDWRGRGFSAHQGLNDPNITFVPPNNTINDLIGHLFPAGRNIPTLEDGNLKKGWKHIEERHITGTHPKGPGDLFPPGTTRAQIEQAIKTVVKKGKRVTENPSKTMQVFEKDVIVNKKKDNVRVAIDTTDNTVVTVFPARQ